MGATPLMKPEHGEERSRYQSNLITSANEISWQ